MPKTSTRQTISLGWNLISSCLVTILLGVASTSASADLINYAQTKQGKLKGTLFVMWVGEDKFVYAPDPRNPLMFTRWNSVTIKPGLMYTDGGSIPALFRSLTGFSPWGYAPAYMVHDWIFVGRHCTVDGRPDRRFANLRSLSFNDSALILAEIVKTLVETQQVPRNDFAFFGISNAVQSPVARTLWDERGGCERSMVDPKHIAAVQSAFGGGNEGRGSAPGSGAAATIVARFNFGR
jgi:hypothetical protein